MRQQIFVLAAEGSAWMGRAARAAAWGGWACALLFPVTMRLLIAAEQASSGGVNRGESQLAGFVQALYWHVGALLGLIILRLILSGMSPHERPLLAVLVREVLLAMGMAAAFAGVVLITGAMYG